MTCSRQRSGSSGPSRGRTGFLAEERTSDAVVRNLEIPAEAAAHAQDDLVARPQGLEWPLIVDLAKNRVVHGPLAVDLELVRRIVVNGLPGLVSRLRAARDSLD